MGDAGGRRSAIQIRRTYMCCLLSMQHSKGIHAEGLLFDNKLRIHSHSQDELHL